MYKAIVETKTKPKTNESEKKDQNVEDHIVFNNDLKNDYFFQNQRKHIIKPSNAYTSKSDTALNTESHVFNENMKRQVVMNVNTNMDPYQKGTTKSHRQSDNEVWYCCNRDENWIRSLVLRWKRFAQLECKPPLVKYKANIKLDTEDDLEDLPMSYPAETDTDDYPETKRVMIDMDIGVTEEALGVKVYTKDMQIETPEDSVPKKSSKTDTEVDAAHAKKLRKAKKKKKQARMKKKKKKKKKKRRRKKKKKKKKKKRKKESESDEGKKDDKAKEGDKKKADNVSESSSTSSADSDKEKKKRSGDRKKSSRHSKHKRLHRRKSSDEYKISDKYRKFNKSKRSDSFIRAHRTESTLIYKQTDELSDNEASRKHKNKYFNDPLQEVSVREFRDKLLKGQLDWKGHKIDDNKPSCSKRNEEYNLPTTLSNKEVVVDILKDVVIDDAIQGTRAKDLGLTIEKIQKAKKRRTSSKMDDEESIDIKEHRHSTEREKKRESRKSRLHSKGEIDNIKFKKSKDEQREKKKYKKQTAKLETEIDNEYDSIKQQRDDKKRHKHKVKHFKILDNKSLDNISDNQGSKINKTKRRKHNKNETALDSSQESSNDDKSIKKAMKRRTGNWESSESNSSSSLDGKAYKTKGRESLNINIKETKKYKKGDFVETALRLVEKKKKRKGFETAKAGSESSDELQYSNNSKTNKQEKKINKSESSLSDKTSDDSIEKKTSKKKSKKINKAESISETDSDTDLSNKEKKSSNKSRTSSITKQQKEREHSLDSNTKKQANPKSGQSTEGKSMGLNLKNVKKTTNNPPRHAYDNQKVFKPEVNHDFISDKKVPQKSKARLSKTGQNICKGDAKYEHGKIFGMKKELRTESIGDVESDSEKTLKETKKISKTDAIMKMLQNKNQGKNAEKVSEMGGMAKLSSQYEEHAVDIREQSSSAKRGSRTGSKKKAQVDEKTHKKKVSKDSKVRGKTEVPKDNESVNEYYKMRTKRGLKTGSTAEIPSENKNMHGNKKRTEDESIRSTESKRLKKTARTDSPSEFPIEPHGNKHKQDSSKGSRTGSKTRSTAEVPPGHESIFVKEQKKRSKLRNLVKVLSNKNVNESKSKSRSKLESESNYNEGASKRKKIAPAPISKQEINLKRASKIEDILKVRSEDKRLSPGRMLVKKTSKTGKKERGRRSSSNMILNDLKAKQKSKTEIFKKIKSKLSLEKDDGLPDICDSKYSIKKESKLGHTKEHRKGQPRIEVYKDTKDSIKATLSDFKRLQDKVKGKSKTEIKVEENKSGMCDIVHYDYDPEKVDIKTYGDTINIAPAKYPAPLFGATKIITSDLLSEEIKAADDRIRAETEAKIYARLGIRRPGDAPLEEDEEEGVADKGKAGLIEGLDEKTGKASALEKLGTLAGKPVVGPDGQPILGADGKPIEGAVGIGPSGQLLGSDGRPILGADGQPILGTEAGQVLGPDGRPVLGPDGRPVLSPAGAAKRSGVIPELADRSGIYRGTGIDDIGVLPGKAGLYRALYPEGDEGDVTARTFAVNKTKISGAVGFVDVTRNTIIWRMLACECLATFMYVTLSMLAHLEWGGRFNKFYMQKEPMFIHGLTAIALMTTFGHVSGAHFNPAISIGFLVMGDITCFRGILFVCFQVFGAIYGARFVYITYLKDYTASIRGHHITEAGKFAIIATGHYDPNVNTSMTALHALENEQIVKIEIGAVYVLSAAYFSYTYDGKPIHSGITAFRVGFAYMLGFSLFDFDYCICMNPARAFGPSFLMDYWLDQWMYWLGPVVGGVLAAGTYKYIFRRLIARAKLPKYRKEAGEE